MADYAETINQPTSNFISLILTDIEMPEMDGYILTKSVKSDRRFNGIPIMTAAEATLEWRGLPRG